MAVIPKQLMEYFSKTPWIKAETLHFNHILIAWLKIHCDGVQRQNLKKKILLSKYLWTDLYLNKLM